MIDKILQWQYKVTLTEKEISEEQNRWSGTHKVVKLCNVLLYST